MSRFSNPLSKVRVASPCPADWDSMIGDERVRFCGQCELNVYNLSAMTKAQAENLIVRTEGRLCVRFYRRKDGSVLTQDCPVGLRALRQRMSRIRRSLVAGVLGFIAGAGGAMGLRRVENLLIDSFIDRPERTLGIIAQPTEREFPTPDVDQMELREPLFVGRVVSTDKRRRH
jgi:hypothetical protein